MSSAAAGGGESHPTLATLAKRKLDAKESAAAASGGPRGRWIHHSGGDTIDESLEVYYCAYCGAHALILDRLISDLPTRSTDHARVVRTSKVQSKLILDEGPCVQIKRTSTLVERQYRYLCKGCGLTLAYRSNPFDDIVNQKYLYLIDGAFALTNTGKTKEQLEAEEQLAPIVIPIFNINKTTTDQSTPTTTTTTNTTATTTTTTAPATSTTKANTPETNAPTTDPPAPASSAAAASSADA